MEKDESIKGVIVDMLCMAEIVSTNKADIR